MNWADTPTISWNQMHDIVTSTIDDANKQMQQLRRLAIIEAVSILMVEYNIQLSELPSL